MRPKPPETVFRTLLNQITREGNLPAASTRKIDASSGFSGGRERKLGIGRLFSLGMAVRAAGAAGLGAGPKGFIDDGLDGARAAAAFGAAAEAAIKLLGVARQVSGRLNGATDIMVAQDVAGTNDH